MLSAKCFFYSMHVICCTLLTTYVAFSVHCMKYKCPTCLATDSHHGILTHAVTVPHNYQIIYKYEWMM